MPTDQLLLWALLPPSACLTLQGTWDPQSPMAEDGVRHTGTQAHGPSPKCSTHQPLQPAPLAPGPG